MSKYGKWAELIISLEKKVAALEQALSTKSLLRKQYHDYILEAEGRREEFEHDLAECRSDLRINAGRCRELEGELEQRPPIPLQGEARSRLLKFLKVGNIDEAMARYQQYAMNNSDLEQEVEQLRAALESLQENVNRQAEDEALWIITEDVATGYIQQELRKLHYCIEQALDSTAPK